MNNKIKDYWEGEADAYASVVEREIGGTKKAIWKREIKGFLQGRKNLEVLDIGCGPGFFALVLSEEGHRVTGIDITENMIKCARQNAQAAGVSCNLLTMDCQALSFDDESFDLLISRDITWTLDDPKKAYREWHRVLRPGGMLLIFDACWYLHLFDPELKRQYEENEKYVMKKYGRRIHQQVDQATGDELGKDLFMSDKKRPDWDIDYLTTLGFTKVYADTEFYKRIWNEKQMDINKMTPEFAIIAEK